jgi:hypothetical protein
MGASSSTAIRYERVGLPSSSSGPPSARCENCGGPFACTNPRAPPCSRCGAQLCRRCYTPSATFDVGSGPGLTTFSLPLALLLRRHPACDACYPDAERERAFARDSLPMLTRGEVVVVIRATLLSETTTRAWLTLHPGERRFRYQSLELANQQPKEAGEIRLDEVAGVQTGAAAATGAGLAGARSSSSSAPSVARESAGYDERLVLRLVNARGHTLATFACTDDRQFKRWSVAVTDAVACAGMRGGTLFPAPAAASDGAGGAAAAAAASDKAKEAARAKDARAADLARRQAEREAFRARIGDVGMTNTARILAARDTSGGAGAAQGDGSAALASSAKTSSAPAAGRPAGTSSSSASVLVAAAAARVGDPPGTASKVKGGVSSGPGAPAPGALPTVALPPALKAIGASSSRAFGSLLTAVGRPPASAPGADGGIGTSGGGGGGSPNPVLESMRGGFFAVRTGLGQVARSVSARVDGAGVGR